MKITPILLRILLGPGGKIQIIMRLSVLLLLMTVIQAFAVNSYSQEARLTMKLDNVRLASALDLIEDQSEYFFLYNEKLIDVNRKVSMDARSQPVLQILESLFKDTEITYSIIDRKIVLAPENISRSLQQRKITGTVSDASGNPLPGVTILLKGTNSGAISDIQGHFSLMIPEGSGSTLVFSFVGMKTQEIKIVDQSELRVIMEIETIGFDGVVVTALGIRREEKALGYSVQSVTGDGLQSVKGVDVGTSLTGKVAGLLVFNSTEFAAEPEIQVRGEEPLLVIDGVPYNNMSLRDISSEDIQDISVLKGATASALYGYRGQSGAIMVTTRKGLDKKGLTVSLNSNTMFNAGFLAVPEKQSYYGRVINTATNTITTDGAGSWGPPMEGQEVIQWDPISKSFQAAPYLPVGKNNFQNFLEPGYISNNNFNVVQQGDYGSVRASLTWVNNKGQYPNSLFNKVNFNMGGTMKLNRFNLTSSISYNKQISPNIGFSDYTGYDPMYSLLVWSAPDWDIRDYEDYWLIPGEVQNNSYTTLNNNPYFDRYERIHSVDRDVFNGSLAMDYSFSDDLKAIFRSGFDTYSNHQVVRISMGSFQGGGSSRVIDGGRQVWGESRLGSFNMGLGRGYSINNDLLLSYKKSLSSFSIDGIMGASMFYLKDEGIEAFTQGGLSLPAYYSLNASVNPLLVNSRLSAQLVYSLLGRLSLSYKSLVFVEGTFRNDYSSTLPPSTRSYLYPSVSGSMIVSELLPDMDWLSLWKVRSSWTSAREPAGIYDINSEYSITPNAWGNLTSASFPKVIRGTDVKAESSKTFELGTMVNVYQNRASVDITYYRKTMFDFLTFASVSPATGYESRYINTDEVHQRRGLEIQINSKPIRTTNWNWDLGLNWSKYATYYTQVDSIFSIDNPWVAVGERTDHFILRDLLYDPEGNMLHSNGLPVFSSYQSCYGYRDPDWIWGLNSSLSYKDLSFLISIDGRVGGLARTMTEMYMWRTGNHPESLVEERYLDATQPGTSNYIGQGVQVESGEVTYDTYGNITSDTRVFVENDVAVTYQEYMNKIHTNSAWFVGPSPLDVYSTTFLKIREISLSYALPPVLCNPIKAKACSVSLVGQNFFLWAKDFKYSDPDGGAENFADPSARYLGFNIRVTF